MCIQSPNLITKDEGKEEEKKEEICECRAEWIHKSNVSHGKAEYFCNKHKVKLGSECATTETGKIAIACCIEVEEFKNSGRHNDLFQFFHWITTDNCHITKL